MDKPFLSRLLEEFYSSEQGLTILRFCTGGMMDVLQSIAETQSQAYITCRGQDGSLDFFPWTVTYHFSTSDHRFQGRDVFSLEATSFWVDTSLRTSCRSRADSPSLPSDLVASFATGLAFSMASWSFVRCYTQHRKQSNSPTSKCPAPPSNAHAAQTAPANSRALHAKP